MSRTLSYMLGIALCVLLPAVVGQSAVDRPMMIQSNIQNVLSLTDYSWVSTESGVCTHGGAFTSTGTGWSTPTGFFGAGTMVMANGDKLNWSVEGGTVNGQSIGTLYFEGGTGRFANATGQMTVSYTPNVDGASQPGFLVFTASYVARGTINY